MAGLCLTTVVTNRFHLDDDFDEDLDEDDDELEEEDEDQDDEDDEEDVETWQVSQTPQFR